MKMKNKKWLKISLISILGLSLTIGGVQMVRLKMEEQAQEQRKKEDKEYEISLAKALKNSYRDIKEIKLIEPVYSKVPGSWSCYTELTFEDGTNFSYRIGHSLEYEKNYAASFGGPDEEKQMDLLDSHRGITEKKVTVYYSDKSKEEK
ncbi:MAG: hypothetical protein Q4A90_05845 [Streptococcus sp.]|nr:hypothetical protein [Streptococcus sp.]